MARREVKWAAQGNGFSLSITTGILLDVFFFYVFSIKAHHKSIKAFTQTDAV